MNKNEHRVNKTPIPKDTRRENNPNEQNESSLLVQQESAYQYKGPIPPPEMLEKYKQVYAQAPEIIMQEFKKNSEHIRQKELLEIKGKTERDQRGQWMAFTICIFVLSVVLFSLYLGNTTFAGLSGLGFIGLIATGILKK